LIASAGRHWLAIAARLLWDRVGVLVTVVIIYLLQRDTDLTGDGFWGASGCRGWCSLTEK
jgi:hypothetical protein